MAVLGASGQAGIAEFHLMAVLPGEPVASGTGRLEYIATDVLPTRRSQPRSLMTTIGSPEVLSAFLDKDLLGEGRTGCPRPGR